jgi:hypothetical protein
MRLSSIAFIWSLSWSLGLCGADLNDDQIKLLQDRQGWEYTAIFDDDNGMQMNHQCFVKGQSGSGECSGTLVFTSDGNFTQRVFVHSGVYQRHGAYELDGGQITFKDELGTKDGPYDLVIKPESKSMRFSMRQAGVLIGADLLLESEYRKGAAKKKSSQPD